MPIIDIKGVGEAQFPDDVPIADIKTFLQNKYAQDVVSNKPFSLDKAPDTVEPFTPSLGQRMGQGVADALVGTGIISDRYGAQRIGSNVATLGEFLPGVGDATAGDEFGRAVAQGDQFGMALGALGVIPVAGDIAKKGAGKIRRVFHGTDDADFDDFDIDMFGTTYGTQGQPAIYTTSSKEDAEYYGRELKELDVDTSDYEEIDILKVLKEDVYDQMESYQDLPFDEWIESMDTDETMQALDFDNFIGNEARYAKDQGKRGIVANFSGTSGGDIILSFNPSDIKAAK